MSNLQISSDQVLQYATKLKQMEQEISDLFYDVKLKMTNVEQVWNSPASKSLIQQFQSLNPVFTFYTEALDQYVIYLNQTAQLYQENEQALQQGIQ